jgi:TolB-like protein
VRKEGRRVRVTAQLNSAADGYHFWSEAYERDPSDVSRCRRRLPGRLPRRFE